MSIEFDQSAHDDARHVPDSRERERPKLPRPGALPYLTVRGAQQAIDWYVETFEAKLAGEPIVMPDGRIGHAELELGGGLIYLAEEFPEMGLTAPTPGATSVSLMLPVEDTDSVLTRARRAGGRVERWTYESYGHRNATMLDPFGHRWMLAGPLGTRIRQGDVGYMSWWTADVEQAKTFYAGVLGWEYEDSQGNSRVSNLSRTVGLHGGHERSSLLCCYAVDVLEDAIEAVRRSGGVAGEFEDRPDGRTVLCTDSGGIEFAMYQPTPEDTRPALNGVVPGDPSYLTLETTDSQVARDFYAAVLGWTFASGSSADGYEPTGVHPMLGLSGGGHGVVVPMWRVDDVAQSVDRVLAMGGTVISGPERKSYGVSAECADDQGGRFYLGS